MALSLAIPLSGLDADQFLGIRRILCGPDFSPADQPISPSLKSDSSGISSLNAFTDILTPSLSPIWSDTASDDNSNAKSDSRLGIRNSTPTITEPHLLVADLCELENFHQRIISPPVLQKCQPIARPQCRQPELQGSRSDKNLKVIYENRDIINLEANLRAPSWQTSTPALPKNDVTYYKDNRSVYHRLGEYGLTEEYPMTHCKDCEFSEPTLFIYDGWRHQ